MNKHATPSCPADQRQSDLLESVRGVFAAKGFDGASMQDLAQAAGMSAGNFYRYFPSKDAIIQAMVERDIAAMQAEFATILNSDDPAEALRRQLDAHLLTPPCDDGPIWAEIVAAAGRRPELGAILERMEREIIANLVSVFARIAHMEITAASSCFHAHAALILTLVQGLTIRRAQCEDYENSPMRGLVQRVFDTILAEIETAPDDLSLENTLVSQ